MNVAIYCRLSSEDRDKLSASDDSASIQNQKEMLVQYAVRNSWHIVGIYIDENYSGIDRNRPEFNRLIHDAKAGRFEIILCKSQSRFTREAEAVEQYIHSLFPALGIRFISLVDHADTHDKGNKKARQINGLVNEWFLEELSENIKSVLTDRRRAGLHIGSSAPYGYRKDPDIKGHLIIDPEAAAVVRRIYALYLLGMGKQAIARTLNEAGIPNPTTYKRLRGLTQGKQYSSSLWSYYTISNILTNEAYIGNMVQGKSGVSSLKTQKKVCYPQNQWIVVDGTHEPIIDRDDWKSTQVLIKEKSRESSQYPEGIFSGMIRCISCGFRMRRVKTGKKCGFRCARHAVSHQFCTGAYISQKKLERMILAQLHMLNDMLLDKEMLESGIQPDPLRLRIRAQKQRTVTELKRKVAGHQAALKALYMQKIGQKIDETEFSRKYHKLTGETKDAEGKIMELKQELSALDRVISCPEDKKSLISGYTAATVLTREMVMILILIDHIEVGKMDTVKKRTPVVIHWNF